MSCVLPLGAEIKVRNSATIVQTTDVTVVRSTDLPIISGRRGGHGASIWQGLCLLFVLRLRLRLTQAGDADLAARVVDDASDGNMMTMMSG